MEETPPTNNAAYESGKTHAEAPVARRVGSSVTYDPEALLA